MDKSRKGEQVRSATGQLMGTVRKGGDRTFVRDLVGRQLGFCLNDSTFDPVGRRIAIGKQPGLLLPKGKARR